MQIVKFKIEFFL